MSSQTYSSMLPFSTHQPMSNHNRPIANFHPCVWGNTFLSCPSKMDANATLKHGELKEEVRRMVKEGMDDELLHKLHLIDTIKRLGVSYHFEREIEEALHNIYEQDYEPDQTHLETASLRFRLLREDGFNVPCEIFNKFKDGEGNFKNTLTSDVKGLLELYEAAHLRVHGEDILDEALVFTTSHLQSAKAAGTIEYPLSALVSNALNRPISKCLPRLEARRFIPIYQQDAAHDKTLLKFAELDFNLWWKDLDVETKLPFIRNRSVEGYFWILGVYFEPQYSYAREILTKILLMTSIMDDIYDAYGKFEELELLTIAIQRWDADCLDQLPDYMKFFYKTMLDLYEELEEAMTKQGKSYRFQYAKDTFTQLSESYFVETKWYQEKYVPTMEEYMRNALVTAGHVHLTITSFIEMEDSVTPEIFKWAFSNPKIVAASSVIGRLMDDIASHKFEQERGHVRSAVECYMRQHGVSEEEACSELKKQVENAWKDINYEMIFSETTKVFPKPVLRRILNLTRVIEFLYKDGDDQYTHVGKVTKDGVASLLIDPVSVSP
ncbi:(+)-delta-cadinene synthase isozyme XC14 [Hibiscus syriacus]|uniref:(+)-delta-cadinene synthase n=1 Tax=Hibiscus syriacus TaxID=106335 RepID=A0A6A2XG95_HIBSY|nr:(+)-delta-cadinene synthase isozyme XC14 [Hibiscus syriacus]